MCFVFLSILMNFTEGEFKNIFEIILQHVSFQELLNLRVINSFFKWLIDSQRTYNIKLIQKDFVYLKKKYLCFANWYCFTVAKSCSLEFRGYQYSSEELTLIHCVNDNLSIECSTKHMNIFNSFPEIGFYRSNFGFNELKKINHWTKNSIKFHKEYIKSIKYFTPDLSQNTTEWKIIDDIAKNKFQKIDHNLFREFCIRFMREEKISDIIEKYIDFSKKSDTRKITKIRKDHFFVYINLLCDLLNNV